MPSVDLLPETFGPAEFVAAFPVSRETSERLEIYAARLRFWQNTINLVAPTTLDDVWRRHFADSAQLLDHIPATAKSLVDVGSGAGFPGLVLAILLANRGPGHRVVLIESDSRKAAFLADVVRHTGIGSAIAVDIVSQRVETAATRARVGPTDLVTARALAPMDRLLGWVAPLFGPNTHGVFLKGQDVETELAKAVQKWRITYDLVPSRTAAHARIVVVRQLAAKTEG